MGTTSMVGARQIYGLVLLLLTVMFFMFTFRGNVPRVVDEAFKNQANAAPQAPPQTPEERRQTVAKKLGGAWHDVPDGAPFQESPGYAQLLQKLVDHVRPGDVVEHPPALDRAAALKSPEFQRSEQVVVTGVVVKHWAEKLDHPVFEITDVWRCVIADGRGDNGIVVDLIDRPPVLDEREQLVEVTGYFYRVARYESATGDMVEVPYLLARSLRVLPVEPRSSFSLSDPANLVMIAAIAAMIVWGILRVAASRRVPRVQWRAPRPT